MEPLHVYRILSHSSAATNPVSELRCRFGFLFFIFFLFIFYIFLPPLDLGPESGRWRIRERREGLISVAGLRDVDGCKHRHPVQKCTNHNCIVLSTYGPAGSL